MPSPSSPPGDSSLVVGLDLGTSGLKAVALDRSGAVVGSAHAAYPSARPEPGASEQDPAAWLAALTEVVAALRATTGAVSWRAIGLSAMLPTLVTVNAEGTPTGPAVTWEDSRAEADGDALRDAVGATDLYARTGQWVDGRYLLPMLARLARVEPARVSASVTLLGAKDYLFGWLTGELATDPSTAAGYGCYDLSTGQWDPQVRQVSSALTGVSLALPEVRPASSSAPLSLSAALALGLEPGLPVCLGAADSVLGAAGMGVDAPGAVAYVAGTSTVVLGIVDRPLVDADHRFLVTPTAHPDRWGIEMDLLATGSSVRWLAGLLNLPGEQEVLALAARSTAPSAPVFLPFLAPGEQGALWDPALTGVLTGLTLGTTSADLAAALIRGIIIESSRCLAVLTEHGFGLGPVLVSGGSAGDHWFRQQLADATGRSVLACAGTETDRSAVGAARLAGESIGWTMPPAGSTQGLTTPDPARRQAWADLVSAYEAILAVHRRLTRA